MAPHGYGHGRSGGGRAGGSSHGDTDSFPFVMPSAWTAALATVGVVSAFGGVLWFVRRRQRRRAVRSLSRKLSNCAIDEEECELELVKQGSGSPGLPPLLLVHGGYHGAWCWQEHLMGWLAERGWTCYAVNLPGRGQSTGFMPTVTLSQCVQGLNSAVNKIAKDNPGSRPPILIGHSAGGGVVQAVVAGRQVLPKSRRWWFVRTETEVPAITAIALMASFPPFGGGPALVRWAWRKKVAFLVGLLTWNLKTLLGTPALFKEMMLSHDFSDADEVARLHSYLEPQESFLLPMGLASRFAFPQKLREEGVALPPAFILGGLSDAIFTPEEIHRTAEEWGTQAYLIKGLAHDVMLDDRWEKAVTLLDAWMRSV